MRAMVWVPALVLALVAATALSEERPRARPAAEVPVFGEVGGPDRVLAPAELERWLRGRALFDRDFHVPDGLGRPDYNGDSCRACHQDPVLGGAGALELNVSRCGFDHAGAGPFEELPGGQVLHKFRPPPSGERAEYVPGTADVFEQRQSPSLLGVGRIDAIPEAAILANEDPTDANDDGIFGVARRVDVDGATEIGRFGWKAQIPSVHDFTRDAAAVECGLTTPDDGRGFALLADADAVADPEVAAPQLDDITFFLRHLAAPQRVGSSDPEVLRGEDLFSTIGCGICHRPALPDDLGQDVFLYSDLLLHRVMPDGFRGMAEDGADVGFYRTPPLWGVRHTAPYLHDGRAETLREAIEGHAGEAAGTAALFQALAPAAQESLLLFLQDL